jgi:hypothetical protein
MRPERRDGPWFDVEKNPMPSYALAFVAPCLIGLAVVLAVIVAAARANRDDLPEIIRTLPEIIRALMRMGPRDSDGGDGPPSLPKP